MKNKNAHPIKQITGSGRYIPEKGIYITGMGQSLTNLHKETSDCKKYGCSIHAPSNHAMKDWPTNWRNDRKLMERICKCGVGHPDPDDISFKRRMFGDKFADVEEVHGCCSCCQSVKEKTKKPVKGQTKKRAEKRKLRS